MSKNRSLLLVGGLLFFVWPYLRGAVTNVAARFSVVESSISNFRLRLPLSVQFNTNLSIANFSAIDIPITGANLDLILDGRPIGNITGQNLGILQANQTQTVALQTVVSLVSIGISVADITDSDSVQAVIDRLLRSQLVVRGNVFSGNIIVPVNQVVRL